MFVLSEDAGSGRVGLGGVCVGVWGARSATASALCTRFYGNPAPVIRSMQFYYCTASNPGSGADDTFVLKRCVYLCVRVTILGVLK